MSEPDQSSPQQGNLLPSHVCVLEELKAGRSVDEAAVKCGVDKRTVRKLMKQAGISAGGRREAGEEEDSGRQSRTAPAGRGDAVQKTLAAEYAELIRQVAEKTRWFNQALVDIGFRSLLAAFQYAKIDPRDVAEKVEEFKDPGEFVEFVMKHIYAMIEASSDSVRAIVERDMTLEKYEKAVRILGAMVKSRDKVIRDLARNLQVANAILTRYGLMDEYITASVQAQLLEQLAIPSQAGQKTAGGGDGK